MTDRRRDSLEEEELEIEEIKKRHTAREKKRVINCRGQRKRKREREREREREKERERKRERERERERGMTRKKYKKWRHTAPPVTKREDILIYWFKCGHTFANKNFIKERRD